MVCVSNSREGLHSYLLSYTLVSLGAQTSDPLPLPFGGLRRSLIHRQPLFPLYPHMERPASWPGPGFKSPPLQSQTSGGHTFPHLYPITRIGGLAFQDVGTICLKPPKDWKGRRSYRVRGWGQYSLPNREEKPDVRASHHHLRGLNLISSTSTFPSPLTVGPQDQKSKKLL